MKTTRQLIGLLSLGLAFAASAANQNLNLPNVSTEADGAFAPGIGATVTITLPPDGKLNYTTINIPSGAQIYFTRNAANTPVYMLASGDVTIDSATIWVEGEVGTALRGGFGGPGGFDGGAPGIGGAAPGDGHGPGGARGGAVPGRASYGTPPPGPGDPLDGQPYGSQLLLPLVGGSGGGGAPNQGGDGGGGAILLASSTRISFLNGGQILARGGGNRGSGGAIRLLAPTILSSGASTLNVAGGTDGSVTAGNGRIRCDLVDRSGFNLLFAPNLPFPGWNPPNVAPVTADQYLPLVFLPNPPTLRIVSIGGIAVPPNADAGYTVTLPLNAAELQPVIVEATGFGTQVPIAIKRTLTSGTSQPVTEATINNSTMDPATLTLSLPFPANTPVTVHAWTR